MVTNKLITLLPDLATFIVVVNEGIQPVKPDQLSITLDKKAYHVGDNVAVTIFSKQAGVLQLNLDADSTLQSQTHQVIAGENTFTMTLDEEANRHDLYLTATLVDRKSVV